MKKKRLAQRTPEWRVIRLCFLAKEWRILLRNPEFIERCASVRTMDDAESLITLGDIVIRRWADENPSEAKLLSELRIRSKTMTYRRTPRAPCRSHNRQRGSQD
jgi:hypothetical protein